MSPDSRIHFVIFSVVFAAWCTLGCGPLPLAAQESAARLTNQDIISMASLGLSDDVIIAKIRSVSGADGLNFDSFVDALKALKDANVSDAVIKTMIHPAPPPAVIVNASAMTSDPNLPRPEVGRRAHCTHSQ